jgi:hypothetical protein
MLPVAGDILVERGQQVDALKVVAAASLPGRYRLIDVARQLALAPEDAGQVMLKTEGDAVEADEILATVPGRLPLSRRSVRAPAAGRIARINAGWILLETEAATVEAQACVNGVVAWIAPGQGVAIEATGALVEAACGFGGEAYGLLKRLIDSPYEPLTEEVIDASCQDTIILGGRCLDEAALFKAEQMQVRGVIVGSFDAAFMEMQPLPGVRVIATEGFGDLPMAPFTFGVLRGLSGKEVFIRAVTPDADSTQDDPAETAPIIVGGTGRSSPPAAGPPEEEIQIGSKVRLTRGRLAGRQGAIESLPPEPQITEAGVPGLGAYVKIDDTTHFVPWANLEQII